MVTTKKLSYENTKNNFIDYAGGCYIYRMQAKAR
jgi:hypothetical protein